jgi:hypothetical protein
MVILVTIFTTIPIIATRLPTKFWNVALVLLPLHAVTCHSHCRKLKTTNFHSPSITQIYALHEGIWRSGGVTLSFAPHTRWSCALTLTTQPLYRQENNPRCPFSSRLGGPEETSALLRREKSLAGNLSYGLQAKSMYRLLYSGAEHKWAKA